MMRDNSRIELNGHSVFDLWRPDWLVRDLWGLRLELTSREQQLQKTTNWYGRRWRFVCMKNASGSVLPEPSVHCDNWPYKYLPFSVQQNAWAHLGRVNAVNRMSGSYTATASFGYCCWQIHTHVQRLKNGWNDDIPFHTVLIFGGLSSAAIFIDDG